MILQSGPDRPPQTPNEWGLVVVLSFFFLLFLALDVVQDFTATKLGIPFFFVSWVFLLVIHEAGHAMMARLLNWRVERVCIGAGKVRYEREIVGMKVEFRTIPLSGFVTPRPRNLDFPRLKHFLIFAAGPGIELVLVAGIVILIGRETMLTPSESLAIIAAQSFCVAALYGAITSLIPLPHSTSGGVAWSDGLGMLMCWGIPDETFRTWMEGEAEGESDQSDRKDSES